MVHVVRKLSDKSHGFIIFFKERMRDDMPHVDIKCFAGRSDEQKKKCADRIAEVIAETLGCKISSVSVAIKDIPQEDWKEQVWDKYIVADEKFLYKKPGYSYDED
jgi:4-oxalocrotonate tautomerase